MHAHSHADIVRFDFPGVFSHSFGRRGSRCRLKRLVLSGCVNVGNSTLIRLAIGLDDGNDTTRNTSTTPPHTIETVENSCQLPELEMDGFYVDDDNECLCLEYYRSYGKKLNANCKDDCERQSALHSAYQDGDVADSDDAESGGYDGFVHRPGYDKNGVPELAQECAAMVTDVALWATDDTVASEQTHADLYTSHGNVSKNSTSVYPNNDLARRDDTEGYGGRTELDGASSEYCCGVEQCRTKECPVTLPCKNAGRREKALEYLDLSGCFQVTDLGIR